MVIDVRIQGVYMHKAYPQGRNKVFMIASHHQAGTPRANREGLAISRQEPTAVSSQRYDPGSIFMWFGMV